MFCRRQTVVFSAVVAYAITVLAQSDPVARPPLTLLEAVSDGKIEVVKKLLADGSDVNELYGSKRHTVLFRAALWGHTDIAKLLLNSGADPMAKDKWGNTAFHIAAENGHLKIAELLLGHHVPFDESNTIGQTPLLLAARNGHEDLAAWLLELGADSNVKAKKSPETPLFYAARRGKSKLVKALLKKHARVNTKGKFGWTPLHAAVIRGDTNTVTLLLKAGPDVNASDERGLTPLLLGVHQGKGNQAAMIDLLTAAGADVQSKDQLGRRVLDLAQQRADKTQFDRGTRKEDHEASVAHAKATLFKIKQHIERGNSQDAP